MVTTTFAVSASALILAGAGINTDLKNAIPAVRVGSDYIVDMWIVQAESMINIITRKNWTTKYASLSNDVRKVLEEAASELAAIKCIIYDMGGYTSRVEAESMINVLRDSAIRKLSLLKDKKVEDFIDGA